MIDSRMIFVIADSKDANAAINKEIALVNFMMTAHPGHVFLCRATFLLIELFQPRPAREWADQYLRIIEQCHAVYCHDGFQAHPMVDYAYEIGVTVVTDSLDLELYLSTPLVDS